MKKTHGLNKQWEGYAFLLPWILGFIIFTAIPMIMSFYYSFTQYDMFTPPKWVGLQNFRDIFNDPRAIKSLQVTFTYVGLGIPLQIFIALLVALALNKGLKGIRVYRAIYYLPSLLGGSVAIAILWRQLFNKEGLFNQFLTIFGIEGKNWIASPDTALYTLIILLVWQFGAPMVIFLSGLKQIPPEYYEAARIDGAGKTQLFLHITLPLLSPIIFFNLVMGIISAFQAFTPAYIISGGTGSPLDSTLFYTLYIYIKGFQHFSMGYASALAWLLLIIISIITIIMFIFQRFWVHYEE